MDLAAQILLYVAAGCLVLLTAMLCTLFYIALKTALEMRRILSGVGREVQHFFYLQRRMERSTRIASRWFAHLPRRMFQAWGERDY